MTRNPRSLPCALTLAALCLLAVPADAQQPSAAWTWGGDANIFVGFNYQERLVADFGAWESQNWFMGAGERPLGAGKLRVQGMLSLEPFTVGKLVYAGGRNIPAGGSQQLFQTGETYKGEPLYHGSPDGAEYRSLLHEHGFEVVSHVVEDPNCAHHTVWLAQIR